MHETFLQISSPQDLAALSNLSLPPVDTGALAMANASMPSLVDAGVVGDVLNELVSTFFGPPAGAIGAGGQLLLGVGVQIAAAFIPLALLYRGVKLAFGGK